VHLFNNAMNFLADHCRSTVVLCTATQPLLDRVDAAKGAIRIPPGNELIRDVRQLFDDLKRVEVMNHRKPGGWSQEEIATLAREQVEAVGSCLVIVNTKKAAQALYRLCRSHPGAAVFHLSTSMCPAHRKAKLDAIRSRLDTIPPLPTLCLSTQLIEAGVDVDFASVIRYAAGLDSIAQAAGRCNRNGRLDCGKVYVVNPRDEDETPEQAAGHFDRAGESQIACSTITTPTGKIRLRRNRPGSNGLVLHHYFFSAPAK